MSQNRIWNYVDANSPIILSVPHAGTQLSESINEKLLESGQALVDTDWHMDKIATKAGGSSASILSANYSRYMVDLNRPKDDKPLYKGATTGLVPNIDFDGNRLYSPTNEPDDDEISHRIETYWLAYHEKLHQEIEAVKSKFGFCLVLDCHSIRSRVPRLFDGILPDINIGTNDGASASHHLTADIKKCCENSDYSFVINGRFKGGFITRNYGDPASGVHVVQIEIAQTTYMIETPPWTMIPEKAETLVCFLHNVIYRMQLFSDTLSKKRELSR